MKIALVGDALSTRALAPFADPTWEIWAAGNGYTHLKRATRYFELHGWADVASTIQLDQRFTTGAGIDTNFWGAPAALGCTHVYTGREVPDHFTKRADGTPTVEPFPFDLLLAEPLFFGYFTSTFAWLIAFAIIQHPDELALYGFDLSLAEYATQKGAIEFMLGQAMRSGINVTIAPRSFILRTPFLYALETAASRRQRSVILDERYILEKELANRQTIMDQAFYARNALVNRVDEHRMLCATCTPTAPCERKTALFAQFSSAVRNEVEANTGVGQIKARMDENTFYARAFLLDDPGWPSPDCDKEDVGLPKLSEFRLDTEYHGPGHTFPLPKEVNANLRADGGLDFEIQDGPSITEVLVASDGA